MKTPSRCYLGTWLLPVHSLVILITSCCFFLILWKVFPLGDAFCFWEDEGYELAKSWMWGDGFSLYHDIWNDQPPVHTFLVGEAFKAFGLSLITARLVTVVFAALCIFIFCHLLYRTSGGVGATAGLLFLIVAPGFCHAAVCAMLELPAFTIALLSVWLAFIWLETRQNLWLWFSGIVMGVALQTKMTSGLVIPALWSHVLLNYRDGAAGNKTKGLLINGFTWGFLVSLTFICIWWFSGENALPMLQSHLGKSIPFAGTEPEMFRLPAQQFVEHVDGVLGAVFACTFIVLRNQFRKVGFPVIFLATCLLVHIVHRPYWGYYYLHFAFPIAWLCGHAVAEAFAGLIHAPSSANKLGLRAMLGYSVGSVLCLLLGVVGCGRFERECEELLNAPKVEDSSVLKEIAKRYSLTHWFYSENVIYNFHSRLHSPPELIVTCLKRFWSGQLTQKGIVRCVERYQPEQLLFCTGAERSSEWRSILATNYVRVYEKSPYVLFVSKTISPLQSSLTYKKEQ